MRHSVTRRQVLLAGAAASALAAWPRASSWAAAPAGPVPPAARRDPKVIEQLGRQRTDDYAWMKDENWQAVLQDPSVLRSDIRSHLEAENAYTAALMAPTKALQDKLVAEMRGRMKEDDAGVPEPDGPYAYAWRYATGAQHPVYVRTARDGGAETVLLDADAEAKGKTYFDVGSTVHSPDHALFGYAADESGAGFATIRLRRAGTREEVGAPFTQADSTFVFTPDSKHLFWMAQEENGRTSRVLRRPVGGSAADDVLVYEEKDPGLFLSVALSSDRAFVLIRSANRVTGDVRVVPASDVTAAPRVLHPREADLLYSADRWRGAWIFLTDADGAVDFKIMTAPDDAPGRASWRDLVPHAPGRYISGIEPFADHLARIEIADARNRIVVRAADGGEHDIAFDEQAYELSLLTPSEPQGRTLRFVYESPTTPKQWFDYDMGARTRTLLKTQEVPSGHDPAAYEVRRISARADGADVPVTLLSRKGAAAGPAPVLLFGYGSYGIAELPGFRTGVLSLVDRGVTFAIAHVRGGSDKGRGWYLDGKLAGKMNSFTDFNACADALLAQGYAAPGRIAAFGGSAGGLLVGAAVNLRPELYTCVLAEVPFVDVMNTMSDTSLPLTPPEWPEWGNPLESAEDYDRMMAYSPYDNVRNVPYPAILATAGLTDSSVTYWEAAKWVARLRATTTGDRPIALFVNMDAGHGGAAGRFDALKERALVYAFALRALDHPDAGRFEPAPRPAPG